MRDNRYDPNSRSGDPDGSGIRDPQTEARIRRRRRLRKKRQRRRKLIRRALAAGALLLILIVLLVRCGRKKSGGAADVSSGAAVSAAAAGSDASLSSVSTAAGAADGSAAASADGSSGAVSPDGSSAAASEETSAAEIAVTTGTVPVSSDPEVTGFFRGYTPKRTADTKTIVQDENMQSNYAVLVNADTGAVVAGLNDTARIVPASMTKILTLLTAVEAMEKKGLDADGLPTALSDPFTITIDITDFAYRNDGSSAGFALDETVTVKDLLYGLILPSGADAAMSLAIYTAGSQEAFVDMMNRKVQELGLSGTSHFTNCVGLYDENLYTTPTDMAMILKAAVENDLCREVLSTHQYTTSSTEQHPEGISLSNWFLRRIEDKDTHGTVRCAKTGFVKESRNCAASYQISKDGGHYICVTADAHSSWRAIYDHVAVYSRYTQ